ncbi:hypothetical protein P3T76_006819 [Phytophthora citrophthora]|uniref:Uncharacterized protein n=1 Tax=Phytophthora citrophthora TaxID=4793 RepID=A0AAD9GN98_9STRA|nr:hypothetical protein P3T76_006819 [Phytophthora citrophthora]
MKSSRDYVDRWLGLSVYKAEVDDHGVETHIQGKVIRYSSSSKHFSLLYMDGSSDEVPVDEIEDYLPLRLQFKEKKYRNKRRAETLKTNTVQSPTKRPRLSVSVAGKTNPTRNEPKQADKLEVMSRFVQDTLWALTMVLDVSEEKQQALLSTLNTRNEQPIAALQQYAKEGGLDALHETLRECAREKVVAGKAETNTHQSAPGRETIHATQDSRSKRTPHVSAHRGRCDKHLRELFHGTSVSESKLWCLGWNLCDVNVARFLLTEACPARGATCASQTGAQAQVTAQESK